MISHGGAISCTVEFLGTGYAGQLAGTECFNQFICKILMMENLPKIRRPPVLLVKSITYQKPGQLRTAQNLYTIKIILVYNVPPHEWRMICLDMLSMS